MMMMDLVWARDPNEGFVLCQMVELMENGAEVLPLNTKFPKRVLPFSDIFQAREEPPQKDYDDNCEMMFLNEGTLLNNIRIRYYKNRIYTYVANILIAVNPYKEIPEMYSPSTIKQYQGRSLGELPPHVFAIADKAFRDMRVLHQSQSIIVSGESGAGKTESTKHLLKYLCNTWREGVVQPIEQKILDANPVLEAFGNAKTTRNNNSSRFGKFIEVHYDRNFHVAGGHISHYLLEKSRICSPHGDERGYHIFYMLMAGADPALRQNLAITKPDDFNYLKNGCTRYFTKSSSERKLTGQQKSGQHSSAGPLKDILLDDVDDFSTLDKALCRIGLTDPDRLAIYSTVAAVLHLGNVEFEENPEDSRGGCQVVAGKEKSLKIASKLLGIDVDEVRQALVARVMQSNRGGYKGTVIMVPLKVYEAINARDALAKAIYSNLFDYIVQRINESIPFQKSQYYIGVLDIAGFEFFTVNSFEQFCINYCNEKLQQFFSEIILKFEQDLYRNEALNVPQVAFIDNQDCIDIIESKNNGILTILDEESKLPKPSYMHFTNEVHKAFMDHFRLGLPRSSKLKAHRSLRDDEGFLIRHFAGAVCYQTKHFIEKNNDALHASLQSIVQDSRNKFVQNLFATTNMQKGKLTFISVGNKFKSQLLELMEKLRQNGTNFIRCIKPNNKMIDNQFDGALSLMQLKCSGMTSVLELMEYGYPSRTSFSELYNMYKSYLPPELKNLTPKIFCEAMLHSLKLKEKDYKFGVTKVFFRPGKFAEFDKIMRSDPENLRAIVADVKRFLVKSRWRKSQFCALTVIKLRNKILYRRAALIRIQKHVRGYLTKKKYAPRIKHIRKIRDIFNTLNQMENIADQLKQGKDLSTNEINKLRTGISDALYQLKTNDKLSASAIETLYSGLVQQTEDEMKLLQGRAVAEEQERLRRLRDEMEAEKRRKAAELARQRAEDEIRQQKIEMEARRKLEEEMRREQEEQDRKTAQLLQEEQDMIEQDERRFQEQLEQERQDRELALRLATEINEQIEDTPTMRNGGLEHFPSPSSSRSTRHAHRSRRRNGGATKPPKYDLTKWKYSELRDTINTSCDIELLEACRHEFHRRLKVYHAWKAKNRRRTTMDENERAPRSVFESAAKVTTTTHAPRDILTNNNSQRYFRIPFVRPGTTADTNNKRGWWYAHFDGQYVVRQIEVHPEKDAAILLIAGKDDMQMCELSLDETGLTRKRGAEILEMEFCKEWERQGGQPYVRPLDRQRN